MQIVTHAATNLDYGLNVSNSGDMDAGLLLNGHTSNSPATMDIGVEMVSAADKMVSGIDMSAASFSGQDIVFQNGTGLSEETDTILTFSEFLGAAEQTADVVGAGETILISGTNQPISSASSVTCSTTTCITAGTQDGQLLILQNVNASDTITIDGTGGGVECKSDITLGAKDTLGLIWNGAAWYCLFNYDNS